VAQRTIQEIGLSYRIETAAIDAYVEHLSDRQ
jgi:tetrahydromethanopterin S-methyltransferase subunit F